MVWPCLAPEPEILELCDGGCRFGPMDTVEVSKRGRGTVQCVCWGGWGGGLGRIFESRAMTAEGEACVRHVCFAFTPWAQLCALSFSQNTGTQQTPSRLALCPTPQQEQRGPHVHISKEIFLVLRYVLYSQDYAYALDLYQRVKLDVIWTTTGWCAPLTGYSLQPASLTCPEGQWMWFHLGN